MLTLGGSVAHLVQPWEAYERIKTFAPTPAWLKAIGAEAKRKGLNKLTMRQIDAEIATAGRERRPKTPLTIPAK
jgi:hypothetical protein